MESTSVTHERKGSDLETLPLVVPVACREHQTDQFHKQHSYLWQGPWEQGAGGQVPGAWPSASEDSERRQVELGAGRGRERRPSPALRIPRSSRMLVSFRTVECGCGAGFPCPLASE